MLGLNKEGSIGMPLPDVEARIISLDDEVTPLPQGEIGELVVRGPEVMFGYHNMPTETQNVLRKIPTIPTARRGCIRATSRAWTRTAISTSSIARRN